MQGIHICIRLTLLVLHHKSFGTAERNMDSISLSERFLVFVEYSSLMGYTSIRQSSSYLNFEVI